jgi:hypothetical protein
MRKLFLLVAAVSLVGLGFTLDARTESADYRIAGTYFESCTCKPVCPCIFYSNPTHGHCKANVIFHVAEGHSGGTELGGTNVVVTVLSPGHMGENMGKMKGVMYLDEAASKAQRAALAEIFTSRFGAMFGSVVGPKAVPIEYSRQGDGLSAKIPEILDIAIKPFEGMGGKTPRILHAPMGFVDDISVAVSVRHKYQDADLDAWEYEAGRNGFFADFEYTSPS